MISYTANLAKDYRFCILYPHIPFSPVPSPSVSAKANTIAVTKAKTIRWYRNRLNKVPFNGFLIERVRAVQNTKLYKIEEVLPRIKMTLTAVHADAKLGGAISD